MCSGSCSCKNNESNRRNDDSYVFYWNEDQNTNPGALEEEDKALFNQGYAEGFKKAREVFWTEFQVKASDANMVAKYILEKDENSIEADTLRIMAATYLHSADILIMDRREYPGYDDQSGDW